MTENTVSPEFIKILADCKTQFQGEIVWEIQTLCGRAYQAGLIDQVGTTITEGGRGVPHEFLDGHDKLHIAIRRALKIQLMRLGRAHEMSVSRALTALLAHFLQDESECEQIIRDYVYGRKRERKRQRKNKDNR